MKLTTITADGVFDAPGYHQGYRISDAESLIFISGQVAVGPDGGPIHVGDFGAQARSAFDAVKRLIEAGGSSLDRIVKLTIFVTDARYRQQLNDARAEVFVGKVPPISVVQVTALMRPEWLVEIEAIAVA